jgi:hypothetical protein
MELEPGAGVLLYDQSGSANWRSGMLGSHCSYWSASAEACMLSWAVAWTLQAQRCGRCLLVALLPHGYCPKDRSDKSNAGLSSSRYWEWPSGVLNSRENAVAIDLAN